MRIGIRLRHNAQLIHRHHCGIERHSRKDVAFTIQPTAEVLTAHLWSLAAAKPSSAAGLDFMNWGSGTAGEVPPPPTTTVVMVSRASSGQSRTAV